MTKALKNPLKIAFWKLPHSLRRFIFRMGFPERAKSLRRLRTDTIAGVTLYPTLDQKCIFVHVPKAAGTSVVQAIFGVSGACHTDVRTYQLALSKDEWSNFYKFTFVRNPWDRCLSAYRYLKRGNKNKRDRRFFEENIARYSNFSQFVCEFLSKDSMKMNHVLRPQYRYICTVGTEISMDFVGRFENLEEDFYRILENLGRSRVLLPSLNASGPKTDYREHYSPEAVERVADLYKTDIELFGYSFQ